jgi:hypothetical protein
MRRRKRKVGQLTSRQNLNDRLPLDILAWTLELLELILERQMGVEFPDSLMQLWILGRIDWVDIVLGRNWKE